MSRFFQSRELSANELSRFNEQGFLTLGPLLTDEGIAEMRAQSMAAWENKKWPFDPDGTWLNNALLITMRRLFGITTLKDRWSMLPSVS
tara:strand:+ start:422 stop:688 length:267 start_codon:yes stop_codon:yes gene_type:complete